MIDYFSIALTHGLIALAAWYLLTRDDLDEDGAAPVGEREDKPWLRGRGKNGRVKDAGAEAGSGSNTPNKEDMRDA